MCLGRNGRLAVLFCRSRIWWNSTRSIPYEVCCFACISNTGIKEWLIVHSRHPKFRNFQDLEMFWSLEKKIFFYSIQLTLAITKSNSMLCAFKWFVISAPSASGICPINWLDGNAKIRKPARTKNGFIKIIWDVKLHFFLCLCHGISHAIASWRCIALEPIHSSKQYWQWARLFHWICPNKPFHRSCPEHWSRKLMNTSMETSEKIGQNETFFLHLFSQRVEKVYSQLPSMRTYRAKPRRPIKL